MMKKILFLVDNDRTIRLFYQEKISLLGLEVMTSDDSEGLYEKIDHHKPDIIFMDMKRWEGLKVYPAFHYDMESLPHGYVIGKAADSKRWDVRVTVDEARDFESLELTIFKHKNQGHPRHLAGDIKTDSLPKSFPHPFETQSGDWNLALAH